MNIILNDHFVNTTLLHGLPNPESTIYAKLTLVFSTSPEWRQVLGGMKWMVCWESLHSPLIWWKSSLEQRGQAAPAFHKILKLHPSQVPSAHLGGSSNSPEHTIEQKLGAQFSRAQNSALRIPVSIVHHWTLVVTWLHIKSHHSSAGDRGQDSLLPFSDLSSTSHLMVTMVDLPLGQADVGVFDRK